MATPDISQLTSSQQEALQTYTSVTDQDPIAAIPLLQRCEWNVQIAIARFFDGEPATDPLAEAQAQAPLPSTRQTANLQYESLLAATRPSRTSHINPEDIVTRVDSSGTVPEQTYQPSAFFSIIFTPFSILYRVVSTILSPFGFLVPTFLSRLFHRLLYQSQTQNRTQRRALPPAENARRFIREFSEDYGDNDESINGEGSAPLLPFVESGFNLTLDTAKKDLKFLLVVLLSPSHDENHNYVRETLLSSQFKSFLDSHKSDLLLWGGNVRDSEAYQVSSSLQCSKFPFAALICQSSESGSNGQMAVILRVVGPIPPSELVAKLGTAITSHQTSLTAARAQQAERQATQNLRQEQDSAYERSLAQDRERARRRRDEEEAVRRAELEAREQASLVEKKKKDTQQWKTWRAQSLPTEPGPEVKDAIRVSIRLPSGERVIRKFRAEAEMEELYAFVECYEVLQAERADDKDVEEPAGYEHEYGFRLVSPMPRRVYELQDGGSIGEKVGKGANLIVEPIADDDGDNED
ncbi:UBX domain-containing protein 10 [Cladophialophora chaetospira]|uniref:UBX domain-containing protein 10 n=1 Tax=Cladophialophora chaetospira TaxID=386627 RepID=A0AA39CQR1_9EURO|nr:UBX domain-containing protein 10 [Cladophialophora chaetospira]